MLKKIIFHADDFNLTPGVNRGIIETHQVGIVKSTSVMINLPDLEDSVKLLKKNPDLDVGLHINLTYSFPISSPEDVQSLLDDNGIFWRNPALLIESARIEEIQKEISAQVDLAYKVGLNLTHIDSHHHIHQQDPRVMGIIMAIAKKNHLAMRAVDEKMRAMCRKEGIQTTDNFSGDFYGKENLRRPMLERIIKNLPPGTSEIMCHPGYLDKELSEKSTYDITREAEVELLKDPATTEFLRKENVRIIGFKELKGTEGTEGISPRS